MVTGKEKRGRGWAACRQLLLAPGSACSLPTHLTPPMSIRAPSAQSSGRQVSEEVVRGLEQEGSGSSFFGKKGEKKKRERENKEKAERGGRCEDVEGRERQMTGDKQRASKSCRQMPRRGWGWAVGKEKNATGQRI